MQRIKESARMLVGRPEYLCDNRRVSGSVSCLASLTYVCALRLIHIAGQGC